jgi:hypothetical protein
MKRVVPLAVFLCVFGLVLTLATVVEAPAPFIYAIFQLRFLWSSGLGALSLVRCSSSF